MELLKYLVSAIIVLVLCYLITYPWFQLLVIVGGGLVLTCLIKDTFFD